MAEGSRPTGSGHDALVAELAKQEQEAAYAQFAIRTRSPLARAVLRAGGETAALGLVEALSDEPLAQQHGMATLDAAVAREGAAGLPADVVSVWAGLLLQAGRDSELASVLDDPEVPLDPTERWVLRTDLANPHRAGRPARSGSGPQETEAAEARWLAVFNEVHQEDGLEPITLSASPDSSTPYQRLSAPTTASVDGELVTIVMSAYEPDRGDLLLAVRGVLAQTWRNFELLVVDDASGADAQALLAQVEAMDPRIRVLHAPANRGTYEARNLALTVARGRWVTFQDSDDWTHPRRLEHQVNHLLAHPEVVANRTWTLRAFPDLTMSFVGYPALRMNASSLLFDRAEVARLVGNFDSTRKTGDMELPLRLRAVRRGSVRDISHPAPLAITQLRSGSLSRGDALPGWIRWDRLAYRDSYLEWHKQLANKRLDPVLTASSGRTFPLPLRSWEPDRESAPEPQPWDVVVLGDLRPDAHGSLRTLGLARTTARAGLRTAAAHAEAPRPVAEKRTDLLPGLAFDAREGRLGVTSAMEEDEVDLLVVTQPESLLHLPVARLRVRQVLVIAHEAEARGWSVAAVDERCRHLLGVDPLWGGPARVHGDTGVASEVRAAVPPQRWIAADLEIVAGGAALPDRTPVLERLVGQAPPARRGSPSPLVIGHHLEDRATRWPSSSAVRAVVPDDISVPGPDGDAVVVPVELHHLRGLRTPTKALGRTLPRTSWLSFAGSVMSLREFLAHLDVWVYFGVWDDAAEIAALEALAAGLPLLLGEDAPDRLHGTVRRVAPEGARRALGELIQTAAPAPHSAGTREAQWVHALDALRSGRRDAPPATTPQTPHAAPLRGSDR